MLTCEGNKVKTPVAKDNLEPTWNVSYVFYRKNADKPILIQVRLYVYTHELYKKIT